MCVQKYIKQVYKWCSFRRALTVLTIISAKHTYYAKWDSAYKSVLL